MDFSFSEEQDILRNSVRRFVRENYVLEDRKKIMASSDGFSRDHWAQFAELGWLMLPFGEDDGGIGGGAVDTMLVMEEFGRGLVLEPYLANIVLAGGALRHAASARQKELMLPDLMEGKLQMALAYAEPQGRYNIADIATMAVNEGDDYVLNGHKAVVLNGPAADQLIVTARTSGNQRDTDGITAFIVPSDADGISQQDYPTQDGFRASEIKLDNVTISKDAVLGNVGNALPLIEAVLNEAIVATGAEAVGIMEELYKATVEYCKTRTQFGVPIGKFQVLQHRMAEMFMEHEQTKSMLFRAALALDAKTDDAARVSSALKVQVGKSGRFVGQQAIQLHGGMGMTDELIVGHYFKRLTMINSLFGNVDYHLRKFAA